MSVVDERVVTVWTTAEGAPARFLWRGVRFVVCARPVAWFERLWWWERPESVRRSAAEAVERIVWRVQARPMHADGGVGVFDLVAGNAEVHWSVSVVRE